MPEVDFPKSEGIYRELFARAPDGMLLVDSAGVIQLSNPKASELFGYPKAAFDGMSVDELVPEISRSRHATLRAGFLSEPRMRPMGSDLSLSALCSDGSLLPVEISLSPITVGAETMVVAVVRDVSERRSTETLVSQLRSALEDRVDMLQALNDELTAYRVLVNSAPDAILLVGSTGLITLANPEAHEILGYDTGDLVGRPVDDLVPDEIRAGHAANRASFMSHPKKRPMGSNLSLSAKRKDGTLLPVEISLSPVESESGNATLALVRDVTDRRMSEELIRELTDSLANRVETLELLNTELETFSYSVSHDLRAPLRAIDGFSLAVLEDYSPLLDDQGRDYLRRIRAAAQRMAQLIDDLLGLSHVSRFELHRESVSVSALAARIIRELQRSTPDRRVDIAIESDITLDADPALLRILLENLIGNAWKFTSRRDNARITVSSVTVGGYPGLQITDNGAGFDPAYAEKIFGPFQRSHAESDFPGTGIGLAIVQRIVARHNGRITAHGELGEGATFTLTLSAGTNSSDPILRHSTRSPELPAQGVTT